MSEGKLLKEIQIDFFEPIVVDGETKYGVPMRRPKLKDQLRYAGSEMNSAEKEIAMFADLCGLPHDAMQELDMVDYNEMQTAYSRFLSSKRPKSANSASPSPGLPEGA